MLHLTIVGNVNKFVTIIPKRVSLRGFAGDQIMATVKIIPEEKYPFKIIGDRTIHNKNFLYKLEEVKRSTKTEYVLTVENLKKEKGRYSNTIKLKTDSKIRPEIKIRVYGNILNKPGNNTKK